VQAIVADLEALGLLVRIAHDAPEWELVVVGHSLGGSVAALVAWLLQGTRGMARRSHAQPVRCWAIDPVGMTCSPALATRMEPFCISVAYGSSWVPRFTGFLDLRKCAPDSKVAV
jgi:pimeloyl-ACP methyl ester carboxylesterase